jgi:hypothetical protein
VTPTDLRPGQEWYLRRLIASHNRINRTMIPVTVSVVPSVDSIKPAVFEDFL